MPAAAPHGRTCAPGPAPSVLDASTRFGSTASKAAIAVRRKNGPATNTIASTTASRVNAISSPNADSVPPSRPKRPNAASSPTPATAGGSTRGSSTSVTASAPAREAPGREEVRGGRADQEDHRLRHERRGKRDPQGVARHLRAQRVEELAGRHAQEDRHHGDDEECERQARRRPEDGRERAAHWGSPNPAARSARRPSGPRSAIRNDWAAPRSRGRAAIAAS